VPIWELSEAPVFPPAAAAEPNGLLAVGGDLRPERLLRAYARGIFPWFERPPILWYSPDPRGVLSLPRLHVPRRLERTLRSGRFHLRLDTAFDAVIRACAAPRPGQAGTWITPEMQAAYARLHRLGYAHSCEAYQGDRLVGGLYGVSLGAAFFGESMFHLEAAASKAALATLCRQLQRWGFQLLDAQLPAAHLEVFGVRSWPRHRFLEALGAALEAAPTRIGPWELDADLAAPGGSGGGSSRR